MGNRKSAQSATNSHSITDTNKTRTFMAKMAYWYEQNTIAHRMMQSSDLSNDRRIADDDNRLQTTLPKSCRLIVKLCFKHATMDIGERILLRAEKDSAFAAFCEKITKHQRIDMGKRLHEFLQLLVNNIKNIDNLRHISEEHGEYYVQLRTSGFRPDFFAIIADGIITEGVYLDRAVHSYIVTVNAWLKLTTTAFSSVRNGYYCELRRLRRRSHSLFIGSKARNSFDRSFDSSVSSTTLAVVDDTQPMHNRRLSSSGDSATSRRTNNNYQ